MRGESAHRAKEKAAIIMEGGQCDKCGAQTIYQINNRREKKMSNERQESKLIRSLGFWDLMGIAIGQIIGVGIMSSTGVAIDMTGSGVVLAFLMSPVLVLMYIYCFTLQAIS